MKKIFTHLFALFLFSFLTTSAWAQIAAGKIYNIVNVGNSGYSLAAVSTTTNSIVATDESDYSQLWYVGEGTADGSYTVRNLSNGFYLQTSWRFAKTEADLYCVTAGSDYTLSATNNSNGYDNMHYGANQGYVVPWSTDASATQWTFNEVTIDNATLQANWDEIAALEDSVSNCATYKALLDNIFSDNACTTIKPGYSEANYSGLPYGLRKMVDKVNSGDWSEPNADNTKEDWGHSYAKRFRLQMYEPYSIAGDITSWLRMNTHANNDNPTGVYVNGRGLVYVMVEGEIKEGATLRLIDAEHNHRIGDATSGGFELKTGLNVIPCYGKGGHLYVCYNVDTYNADGTTAATRFPESRKLSNYPPLKIHIEGGAINGYYNACGDFLAEKTYDGVTYNEDLWKTITNYSVDCDADWVYMEERANLRVLPILAHRQILLFQLEDTNGSSGMKTLLPDNVQVPTKPYSRNGLWDEYNMRLDASNCKINIMMEAWDRIMYSEHATLGLVSQSTMDKMNELYPRWNADGTTGDIYAYDEPGTDGKTYKEFCEVDYSEYFNHHGVGLGTESGYMSAGGQHCNYNISTFGSIIGQIASNAGSLWGPAHEIGHQHQSVFNIRGGTEVTNNVFSNAAVWYMGMATSRVNGTAGCLDNVLAEYNAGKPFIDYNIWAMTQLFYKLWLYYHVAGHNTQFYPRFFEMLRRDPLNATGGTANGTESMLKIYEKMCDASGEDLTEFFRIHGFFVTLDNYPKDDYGITVFTQTQEEVDAAIARVKSKYSKQNLTVILINDGTPEASVAHDGTTKRALWDAASAEFGAVGDYIDGNTSVSELYDAVVSSDGTVTMSGGEGGVGFLVLDENGKVVSFSNKSTFALSDEAAYLLATGKAELVALDGEDNKTEANVDLTAVQSSLMEPLVADVENLLKYVDDTYTKVGYFKASSVVDLQSALETAKATIETGTGLAAAYELLYTEYQNVLNDEDAKVAIISGAKYAIKSKPGNDYMDVDDSGNVKTTDSSTFPTDDSDLWIIEIASKDTYKIKNASTGKYLQEVSDANGVNFTVGDNAVNYGITNVDYIYHAFSTKKYPSRYMDRYSATQVATWGGDISNNAKWHITLADNDLAEKSLATAELQAIVEKTEALVNSLATVSTTNVLGDELSLQCTAPDENYYISCSNPHPDGADGAGGVAALLDNDNGTYLHTNWSQVSVTNDYLQVYLGDGNELNLFRITGVQRTSATNDFPKTIEIKGSNDDENWTTITTVTDLPTKAGATWERDVKSLRGYKYLRFIVTTNDQRIFFHMAEFSIFNLTSSVSAALLEEYNEYSATLTEQLITEAYEATERGKEWIACSDATAAELEAYASTLQDKYDALYTAYKKVIDAEKAKLQSIIDDTEDLITQVGTATVTADAKIDLLGKLYAERPYTAGGTSNSDYSTAEDGYNLLDGNTGTHFHSDYNYSTMVSPPYIRVDLGEGSTANKFKFNYTTRDASGCAPTKINVYGGVAGVEYSQGAIQSSAALNAVTTPTKIVIKNLSGTNSKYFAGASNETDINAAVLVWEPVEDGVAGRYYLRTTDAVSGYIQNGNTTVELGTIDNAQVFVTTSPSTTGANATYFNGESLVNADLNNLVRFVQEGGSTWLNVQDGETGTPCLGHTGKGGWTVHNVYLVTENDTPLYDATPIATFTSGDASNPLPTAEKTLWTSTEIISATAYRYFKFEVAVSEGYKEENSVKKYYFAISEFGFQKLGEVSATIYQEYTGIVSESLLIDTRRTVNASETMVDYATDYVVTVEQIKAQIAAQQAAKDKLYAVMNNTAALKENLKKLIDDTQALYDKMATDEGAVNEYYSTSSLTAANLSEAMAEIGDAQTVYDNSSATVEEINTAFEELNVKYGVLNGIEALNVADRADLDSLITTMQGLLDVTTENGAGNVALQIDDESAPFYIWSNAPASDCNNYSNKVQGLIDENNDGSANTGTFFGTYWYSSVDAYTHYIEIDLGTDNVFEGLSIDYTTRESGAPDSRPNGLKFMGSNDKVYYEEFHSVTEGLPSEANTKWSMETPIELAKSYRYIRIAVSSPHGSCFNMSDFNLYSRCIATVKEYYSTSDIFECLPAVLRGYCDAKEAMTVYLTADAYDTAKAALQAQINALQAIVGGNVSDRDSLSDLADATMSVLESVATISEEEKELTMQCTDANAPYYLYCNADGTTHTTHPNDAKGVEALLDTDTDNHLHTTYQGEEDDDLDHYLRLDMGENEAMMSFKFSYTGRVDGNGNAPKTMVIEGSNDLDTFDVIATLTDLPTTDTKVTYTTPSALGNGKAYRYIRFMVTETKNNDKHNGHPYFVLSQFSVTACKTIEVNAEYVSPNLPLSTLVSANNEVVDAKAVVDCVTYVTQNTYDTAFDELQAAKDALEAGKNLKDMPVILTTDVNNPVLYKIQLKRNNNVFTYDGAKADASKKPVLAAEELGNRYQAWYFMQGTNSESYDDILIMPYYNEGAKNTTLRLSYANNNDGTVPAVVASGTNATDNWYITFTEGSTTEGWWNLQPEGGSEVNAYVNQYGASGSTKLAFWRNANNPSDVGSQFQFVLDETDYSLSDAYYALYHQHAAYHVVEGGTAIGAYTQATADAFNSEYYGAKDLLDAKNSTDDEYDAAREDLVYAYEALTINMPDPAKYYVLRCNHEGRYIYVNADNKLQWAASSYDKAQSRAVWQFEEINDLAGTCKMKSLHTQSYMQTISSGNQVVFSTEGGAVVTIAASTSVDGAAIFEAGNNNIGLHAHGSENRVIGYGNGAGANHYFFEEVEDVTTIKHDVTMKTQFSSVTLGYNATVPAGVEAYTASGLEDGYTTLHKVAVATEVLPANTPVILYIPEFTAQTTVTFNYTESEAVVDSKIQEAIDSKTINGSLYTKYVECDDADYYKLMIKNNEAKMYLMYKEFDETGKSLGATHAGGHIKCSANKIYMRISGANGMASFGMRFATPGTTGIDELKGENAEGKEIYDLTGRKLSEITEPGFYIVNGKKMYVK